MALYQAKNSINRQERKQFAHILNFMEFTFDEILNFLGVSTQTLKIYLNEPWNEDSMIFMNKKIRHVYTEEEQILIRRIDNILNLSEQHNNETDKKKKDELIKQIKNMQEKISENYSGWTKHTRYPHLLKLGIDFNNLFTIKPTCTVCGKQFSTKKEGEKHAKTCE